MMGFFQLVFLVLTTTARSHRQLIRDLQYSKVELAVLRGKIPGRVTVTPAERARLVRYAKLVGSSIRNLVTIVSPSTVQRWIREDKRDKRGDRVPKKRGRHRTPEQIRRLALKLALENDWGYTRIIGELKKLGITPPSKNTVKRILRSKRLDPGPKRGRDSWDEFLRRHAHSLWQCDLFSRRVMTIKGMRDAFVLAFVHVKTRQVVLSPATFHPNDPWVQEQAKLFVAYGKILERKKFSGFSVRFPVSWPAFSVEHRVDSTTRPLRPCQSMTF